jgi:type II secretion system protein G
MDRFYKMMKKDNKGFTLVELMVVLLILGILVAIAAMPIYNKTQENAQKKACQSNLRTLDGAAAQYHAATGAYPNATDYNGLTNLEGNEFVGEEGYIKELPTCPGGGVYNYDATNGKFSCNVSDHVYP